jgi:hypothetical protein
MASMILLSGMLMSSGCPIACGSLPNKKLYEELLRVKREKILLERMLNDKK